MIIEVKTVCGETCVIYEHGAEIARKLIESGEEEKILDFNNVKIFSSPFFNALLGPMFNELGEDSFNKNVKTINISDNGKATMERVVKNLKENKADPDRKKIQIDAINKRMQDSNGH